MKRKCTKFVDKYGDRIIDSLANGKNDAFCRVVVCDSSTETDINYENAVNQVMTKYSKTPQCVICEIIAQKLNAILERNSTMEMINSNVHRVCSLTPKIHSDTCDEFITNYVEFIVVVIQRESPADLCTFLDFCHSSLDRDTTHEEILECGVCNVAVDALKTVHSYHGSKDKDTISKVTCNLVPSMYREQVRNFDQVFGFFVVKK